MGISRRSKETNEVWALLVKWIQILYHETN